MSRTRNKNQPFYATALGSMVAGPRQIVRELDGVFRRSFGDLIWPGSGWRPGSVEHSSGTAIDFIIVENTGRRPTPEELKVANEAVAWLIQHHEALGIEGILFSPDGGNLTQVIGYSQSFSRGWRNLGNRGSVSANHIDHFHIKFKRSGASWPSSLNGAVIGGPSIILPPKTGVSKTVSEMATEVINGLHGNGHTKRQRSLGVSLSEYEKVRAEVNRRTGTRASTTPSPKPAKKSVTQMAAEVIDGKHGTGHSRRMRSLGISASEYEKVRAEVNRRVSGTPSKSGKSISQMATEVINGLHGNGHGTRRRSLGVSQSVYEQVRAAVNRRV